MSVTARTPDETVDPTNLAAMLAAGDATSWESVIQRYGGLVWAVARAYRLDQAMAEDVYQVTWLRLLQHVPSLRKPEWMGAWLAVTARRESLRALRLRGREIPTDRDLDGKRPELEQPPPDVAFLESERDAALWRAFEQLPDRCRRLLRLLFSDPPPTYIEVAAALNVPIGSIGPTRARCLECLRRSEDVHRLR